MARDLRLEVVLAAVDKVTAPLARIQNSNRTVAQAFKASREQLKQLQAVQDDISSFRSSKVALLEQASASQAAQAKVQQLAGRMREVEAPTRAMTREFNRAVREAQAMKASHAEQQQTLQRLREKLSAAGISTRNLNEGERQLRQSMVSTTQTMAAQEGRLKRLANQQKQLAAAKQAYERTQATAGAMAAGGAAGLATGYALTRPLKAVVDAFAPSEEASTQLKVSMMSSDGTVAADFQKVTDLANSLGDRLPGTTADFQNMMTMLLQQGISAKSVLGGTGEAAAYLGVQLKLPAEQAAELAANMQDATGTSERDMMALMDMIQKTANLGVPVNDIIQGFSKMSPAMNLVGEKGLKTSEALAPLLAMMTQTGMAGESAGNAIRKVFQAGVNSKDMAAANAMLKKDFKLGFQLDFTDGKGNFGGMENLFKQLEKLRPLNDEAFTAVVSKVFGEDGETLQVVQAMMDKGLSGYNDVAAKMKAQADLRRRVNEQLGTLTNTMEAAEGSWSNTLSAIGATIAPELKALINGFGNVAVKVKAWVQEHPVLTAAIVKTVGGLALLATAGGAVMVMLAGVLGPLAVVQHGLTVLGIKSLGAGAAFKGIGSAMLWVGRAVLWVGRAMLMNPIGLAVTAIAGAAYLIYKNWEPIKAFFLGLWDEVKAGFNGGLAGIAKLILDFSPLGLFYRAFAGVMSYFGVDLPARFSDMGGMLLDGLVSGIRNKLGAVKDAIGDVGDSTIGWFKEKLGIHSPSRVFAELGGFTMAGLEQGLQNGQDGPLKTVLETSKRLAQISTLALGIGGAGAALAAANSVPAIAVDGPMQLDSRPPLSATSAAPSVQPAQVVNNYNITINGSGLNEAKLADLIGKKIEQIKRADQAKARSRLGDLD